MGGGLIFRSGPFFAKVRCMFGHGKLINSSDHALQYHHDQLTHCDGILNNYMNTHVAGYCIKLGWLHSIAKFIQVIVRILDS